MKPPLTNAPLTRWTRKLSEIKREDPEAYSEIISHPGLDLKNLFRKEFAFRASNHRNVVLQVKGPAGSGKSKGVGLPMALMILPCWRPKGSTFYTDDDVMQASNKAPRGAVILKDEDPREGGQGSGSISDALANLESACARFAQINYVIINPTETSHLVDFVIDTTREESRRRDGKLISVVADVGARSQDEETLEERRLNIGKIELDVPESLISEYETIMSKFKDELRSTGGIGVRRDVYARYAYLLPKLIADPDFLAIPPKRDGFFTDKHSSYISAYHGVNERDADLFLLKAWREITKKVKIAPVPRSA